MRATAEVRWFRPGPVPAAAVRWFDARMPCPDDAATRTDHYLHPAGPGLNVKLREGRVEVKRRDGPGRQAGFGEGVTGCVERWRKWTWPLQRDDEGDDPALPGAWWVAVTKRRRRQGFTLVEGAVTARPPDDEAAAERGCDLELTQVTTAAVPWWSLCLEAYGPEEKLAATLHAVAEAVFAADAPPGLDAAHSKGYPAWLRTLPGPPFGPRG